MCVKEWLPELRAQRERGKAYSWPQSGIEKWKQSERMPAQRQNCTNCNLPRLLDWLHWDERRGSDFDSYKQANWDGIRVHSPHPTPAFVRRTRTAASSSPGARGGGGPGNIVCISKRHEPLCTICASRENTMQKRRTRRRAPLCAQGTNRPAQCDIHIRRLVSLIQLLVDVWKGASVCVSVCVCLAS